MHARLRFLVCLFAFASAACDPSAVLPVIPSQQPAPVVAPSHPAAAPSAIASHAPAAPVMPATVGPLTPEAGIPAVASPIASSPSPSETAAWPPCISYTTADAHVGQTVCVTGTVRSATQSGSTYFINFDSSRASFYAVSFTLDYLSLPLAKDQCIRLRGRIDVYNGRPQIVLRDASQIAVC